MRLLDLIESASNLISSRYLLHLSYQLQGPDAVSLGVQ
jgi:hypothetical protein